MKDSLSFRFDRFSKLLRNEIQFNHRNFLIVAAGAFCLLLFIGFIIAYGGDHVDLDFFYIWYGVTLLGGGFLYTSMSFKELNQPQTAHTFLMTPASTLEKFLSKWLLTTIGFLIVHLLLFLLYVGIFNLLQSIFGNDASANFEVFNNSPVTLLMKIYLILQSLYLLGAVWFKRFELFKTGLATTAASFILSLMTVLLGRIVFFDFFDGFTFIPEMNNVLVEPSEASMERIKYFFENIALYILCIGSPLLLWTVGFFKLKEKEV